MNTIRGTVELRGRDQTDGLYEMLIKMIQLARVDATGDVKGAGGPLAREYWQQDAMLFLQSLDELKADLRR